MNLETYIINNEVSIRLSFFFGVFFVMALWELLAPRRLLLIPKVLRWSNNIALVFLNSVIVRLLFPAAAIGMAAFVNENGWGISHTIELSFAMEVVLSVIILDAIIYFQHVMMHAVPVFWRLHRVHHADPDFDVTTGSRFHPAEIVLSMLIKFAAIIVLGPPILAVIIFEILLSSSAMFNHSNVRLNTTVDRFLRLLVVTPDMHRVHHSVEADEANSNFGFSLPWWDRLFGTYRAQPRAGHKAMSIGIHQFNRPNQVTYLHKILILPFIGKITDYALNRRYSKNDDSDA